MIQGHVGYILGKSEINICSLVPRMKELYLVGKKIDCTKELLVGEKKSIVLNAPAAANRSLDELTARL